MTSLDLVFQALADPTRRRIVERLMRGPQTVSDLAQPFGMTLPAVAHHVRVLERGGVIRSEKRGRIRTCRVEPKAVLELERWVAARRADWKRRLLRLEGWLEASEAPKTSPATKADGEST